MGMSVLLTKYRMLFEKTLLLIANMLLKVGLKPDHLTMLSLVFSALALISSLFFPV